MPERQWTDKQSSGNGPAAHPFDARQVACRKHPGVSRRTEQLSRSLGLVVAVLEQQPAAGMEMLLRARDDAADIVQSVRAGSQRAVWLEAQVALREMRGAGGGGRGGGDTPGG